MRGGTVTLLGWIIAALIGTAGFATAAQSPAPEDQLRDAAIRIDRAATTLGEAETVIRLAAAFKVPSRTVTDLHDEKLDFGEVALVLALAEGSKAKPEAILSLWATDRLGWSDIVERYKINRQALQKRLDGIRRALAQRPSSAGKPSR